MPGWAQDATANKTEKSCILGEFGSYTINTDIRQAVMSAVKKNNEGKGTESDGREAHFVEDANGSGCLSRHLKEVRFPWRRRGSGGRSSNHKGPEAAEPW